MEEINTGINVHTEINCTCDRCMPITLPKGCCCCSADAVEENPVEDKTKSVAKSALEKEEDLEPKELSNRPNCVVL